MLRKLKSELGSFSSYPQNSLCLVQFYKAKKILYCDGTLHQGHKSSTVTVKGTSLYFRGYQNALNHFNYLINTLGMGS